MKKTLLLLFTCLFALVLLVQAETNTMANTATVQQVDPEPTEKDFEVYPNPSQGVIQLSLVGFENKKAEVRITNVIGNLVHRDVLSEPEGRYVKAIDLTRFPKGVYYVKIQADEFSEIRKIIIK